MATAQIPWNDGSGHDISVEWDGTQDGEIKVSSPTNPSLTAQRTRSIQVQTTAGSPQVTRTITVVQEAAVYTYEYSVIASPSDILPASGGSVTYTAQLKTYLQGNLLKTESVTPTCRVISGTGFSALSNAVTAANRGTEYSTSQRSAQVAVEFTTAETGETLSETVTVTQAANNRVVVYGKPTITSFEVADIPASGGSVSSGDVEYSQSRHYYYDSGQTEELSSLTTGGQVTFGDPVAAESLGTTVKSRTIVGQLTCQVAMNGQTSVEGDASVYQQANSATYGAITLIVTSPVSVEATGGTFDIVSQAGQTVSFTSGAIRAGSVSLSYSQLAPVEGFVLDGSQVTVSNNTTTEERSYTVRVTAEGEGGLSMIKSVKFNQDAGVRTYSDITITEFKYPQISATGGTVTPTLSYSQTWGWNGSTTGGGTITSGASVTYEGDEVDTDSGEVSAPTKGTTVSGVTTVTTSIVNISLNGKTVSGEFIVQQAANAASYSISLSAQSGDIPASGGSKAITASGTISYTSGSTGNFTPTLSVSGTGFSLSGTTITAASRGTTVGERRSCTVTASYSGATSQQVVVYQEANEVTSDFAFTQRSGSLPANGFDTSSASTFDNRGFVGLFSTFSIMFTSGEGFTWDSTSPTGELLPSWVHSLFSLNAQEDYFSGPLLFLDGYGVMVMVSIEENTGSERSVTGDIEFTPTGEMFSLSLTQAAGSYLRVLNSSGTQEISSLSFPASGGSQTIIVDTNESWTIS